MIDETLFEAEEKMDKAVSVCKDELGTIRTGRATPAMFAKIVADFYGLAERMADVAKALTSVICRRAINCCISGVSIIAA